MKLRFWIHRLLVLPLLHIYKNGAKICNGEGRWGTATFDFRNVFISAFLFEIGLLMTAAMVFLLGAVISEAGVNYMDRIKDCDVVNPYEHAFVRWPRKPCDGDESKGRILLCLISSVDNLQERDAVRHGIGNMQTASPIATMFFFGSPDASQTKHAGLAPILAVEANTSNDVIQSDFTDSPDEQNLKILSILKWVSESCHTAPPYVIVTTTTRVLKEDFESRLDLLIGEMRSSVRGYPHFVVGPLRVSPLDHPNPPPSYCPMHVKLSELDWTLANDEVRIFPPMTAEILLEASQRTLWTDKPKGDVVSLSAAMVGIPFLRKWSFWPYTVNNHYRIYKKLHSPSSSACCCCVSMPKTIIIMLSLSMMALV